MIGKAKRLITEEKVRNASCSHCKEQNTLMVKIYSTIFILKILPFILGKSTELSCISCKKAYGNNDILEDATQRKIDLIKQDAKHAWFLYIGYGILILGALISLTKDIK